jgi:hypothetical protein
MEVREIQAVEWEQRAREKVWWECKLALLAATAKLAAFLAPSESDRVDATARSYSTLLLNSD